MTVDLSEFHNANGTPGTGCSFAQLVDGLDDERRDKLLAAMQDPAIQHRAIERVIRNVWNLPLAHDSIGRHRRGDCRTCRD